MTVDDSLQRALRERLLARQRGDTETAHLIARALAGLVPRAPRRRTLILPLVRGHASTCIGQQPAAADDADRQSV